jgi:hypothetical protein
MGSTMILPDFVLPSRVHQQWDYSGMDSVDHCLDKKYFLSYPHKVHYSYNSRGFRDEEWPNTLDELKNAIWCFGDSFTVGVGQPFDHIWPQVLSTTLGRRIINVSMDGASNDWIIRKLKRVHEVINPKNIVILWSYTHRRELPDADLLDEQRMLLSGTDSSQQDVAHWIQLTEQVKNLDSGIVQATIPYFHRSSFQEISHQWSTIKGSAWPNCPRSLPELENLPEFVKQELKFVFKCYKKFQYSFSDANKLVFPDNVICIKEQLDWARDYHHFDLLTAQWLVDRICQQLNS